MNEKEKILNNPNIEESVKNSYRQAKFAKNYIAGFKSRHGFRNLRVNGERCSVPENVAELMNPIISLINELGITVDDVFNFDETGLFTRALPGYTMAQADDDGGGTKKDKSRITAALLVNATGTVRKLIIIGKSKCPRGTSKAFFKENDITYFSNESAWMTEDLFNKFLAEWDKELNHHIVLLLDNFKGHDIENDYEHIIIIFLPPNTTSKTQPLDGGIIASLKAKYRTKLLSFIMFRLGENSRFTMNEVNVKQVIPWINESWKAVKNETIVKCFKRCLPSNCINAIDVDEVSDGTFEDLRVVMESNLQREVSLDEAIDYATPAVEEPNEFNSDEILQAEEEEDENVVIRNPKIVLEKLEYCRTYFTATGETHASEMARNQIQIILRHLNFE